MRILATLTPQDNELRLQKVLTPGAVTGTAFEDLTARFLRDAVGQGMTELTEALREHSSWLARNAGQQTAYYSALVAERGAASGGFDNRLTGEERRRLRAQSAADGGAERRKQKAPAAKGSEQARALAAEIPSSALRWSERVSARRLVLRPRIDACCH